MFTAPVAADASTLHPSAAGLAVSAATSEVLRSDNSKHWRLCARTPSVSGSQLAELLPDPPGPPTTPVSPDLLPDALNLNPSPVERLLMLCVDPAAQDSGDSLSSLLLSCRAMAAVADAGLCSTPAVAHASSGVTSKGTGTLLRPGSRQLWLRIGAARMTALPAQVPAATAVAAVPHWLSSPGFCANAGLNPVMLPVAVPGWPVSTAGLVPARLFTGADWALSSGII